MNGLPSFNSFPWNFFLDFLFTQNIWQNVYNLHSFLTPFFFIFTEKRYTSETFTNIQPLCRRSSCWKYYIICGKSTLFDLFIKNEFFSSRIDENHIKFPKSFIDLDLTILPSIFDCKLNEISSRRFPNPKIVEELILNCLYDFRNHSKFRRCYITMSILSRWYWI